MARPRLTAQLSAALPGELVLVSAPAGYGKTTLVAQALAAAGRPVAWLSLEASEDDPARFVAYLCAALGRAIPGVGQTTTSLLLSSQRPDVEAVLTPLINDLDALDQPLCLVLDDYHVIDETAVRRAVEFLLDHQPAQLTLFIA